MKRLNTIIFACSFVTVVGCKLLQSEQKVQAIIGADNRIVLNDSQLLSRVGAIGINNKKSCTGFLISKDVVATAFHCVPSTNGILFSNVTFHLQNRDPIPAMAMANANAKTDIAFLKLRDSVDVPPFRISQTLSPGRLFDIPSYDKTTNRMLISKGCEATKKEGDAFFTHNCDTLPGASGAPVIQNGVVVGMHMGASKRERLNIAVDANTLKNGDLGASGYFNKNNIIPEGMFDQILATMGEEALKILVQECREGRNTNVFLCAAADAYMKSRPEQPNAPQTQPASPAVGAKVCTTPESTDAPKAPSFTETPNHGFALASYGTQNLWPTGSTIRIRFLNGTQQEQDRVMRTIRQWPVNLKLIQVTSGPSDIRIQVPIAGVDGGSHSQIGRGAMNVSQNDYTLTLGWWEDGTTLHEFGHALSFIHEHQSPGASIPWNKDAVYTSLAASPNNWNKAKVDVNIFARPATTNFTKFDPNSIMIYDFPASWTTSGMSVSRPSALSPTDIAYSSQLYPGPMVSGAGEGEDCAGFAGVKCNETFYKYGSDSSTKRLSCVVSGPGFDAMGVCRAQ